MIITAILSFIIYGLGFLLSPLPTVDTLPYGVDTALSVGVGYFNVIASAFPPFGLMMQVSLIYISYRIALMVLKLFLGSRVPHLS